MQIYILLFLFFSSFSGYAQFTLYGKVTNEKKQPLTESHIHSEFGSVLSDPAGEYVLKDIPKGKLRVYISYIGYQTCDTLITITEDFNLNIKLRRSETALEEVVLKDAKQQRNTNNSTSISMKQLEKTVSNH